MLGRLSVLAEGWILATAAAVAWASEGGEWLVLEHLASLVGKSLV